MTDLSFKDIAQRINNVQLDDYDLVIGIKEGGLVPAALIAYKLNCNLSFVKVSRRDEDNRIIYDIPKMGEIDPDEIDAEKILIVDDVSVTGKTLDAVKERLNDFFVKTLAFKGKGDYVLFPEIKECVNWPWR